MGRSSDISRYTESVLRNSSGELPKRRGRPPAGGREAILAAALKLLRERGIARVTSREVAALAGVSEASVFYHYKDRAGLLQAVFEQGLHPLRELVESGWELGPDLHEVLTRFGTTLAFMNACMSSPSFATCPSTDIELSHSSPESIAIAENPADFTPGRERSRSRRS